jgi:hypothetical protein
MNKLIKFSIAIVAGVVLGYSVVPIYIIIGIIFGRDYPVQYIIPQSYIGWVWVNFEVPDAPSLPKKNGYWVIEVNKNGVVNTSNNYLHGWREKPDVFFRYTSDGTLTKFSSLSSDYTSGSMIHGFTLQDTRKQFRFFVGTKEQFKEYAFIHQQPEDIHHWVESREHQ